MKRSLWKELCNKLNFASKTNCKSFEVTPIIRTVYITHPSPVHLCLSPFCVWLPLGYGNWRNSHVSISTAARLNERILCPFFNREGLFKSGTQNKNWIWKKPRRQHQNNTYLFIYYFPTIKITQALHYTKMWRGDLRKPQGLYEEAPSLQ